MFDGAALVDAVDPQIAEPLVIEAPAPVPEVAEPQAKTNEIVFVDTVVADYQDLLKGIDPDTEVIFLDGNRDGLVQMTEALSGRSEIDALHIVSHGQAGMLKLGSSLIDQAALEGYGDELASIGATLSLDGDILLYGCNIAEGSAGEGLIQQLASMTKADIAASTDATGSSELEGDWVLETNTGEIEADSVLQAAAMDAYDDTLGTVTDSYTGYGDNVVASGATLGDFVYTHPGDLSVDTGFGGYLFLSQPPTMTYVHLARPGDATFQAISLEVTWDSAGDKNFSVEGWRSGARVTSTLDFQADAGTATHLLLSADSQFGNIDQLRITGSDMQMFLEAFTYDLTPVAANAAPTQNANTGSSLNEGATDIITNTELHFDDDSSADTAITYTVTTDVTQGELFIDNNSNGTNDGPAEQLDINETFTQQDINDNKIKYVHGGGELTSDSLGFKVTDGDAAENTGNTFSFTVTGVNDNPTNSGTFPTDISVTEDVAGNVDLSGMTLADVDSAGSGVVVTLTATGGTLAATTGGSVTVGGSGTGTLTLTGTVANIDTFLNAVSNIKYTGAAHANGEDAETVAVKINDGDGSGDVALGTFNMDITAVNDNPTNSGTFPTDIAVTEDVAGNVDLSGMTLADVDSAGSGVVVTLTSTGGTLAATTGGSVTVGGSGTGTLTLTGTVANIDTFLNTVSNIKYTGAANANGEDAETVAVKINDGDG
ncbi:MAG: DUF4347 domain-containing protein, partial [Gammaproteobacteria bacterium]|nr:DUF4347 domain-containing protein [Gammaproteobacteria bacterium]